MLDSGFSSKHQYYYCGEDVVAEPEHIDDGLARFAYTFSDNTRYHLHMLPPRKDYTRRLLRDVGFQRVTTYGDFQAPFPDEEPDLLIRVPETAYTDTSE